MIHKTTTRVYYADTDHGGAVYYANYLKWFEMGRVELLRKIGITQSMLEKEGLLLPVVEVKCQYRSPARHDDKITIETKLERLGNSSITFSYRILREDGQMFLAEGHTVNVLVKGKTSAPFSADLRGLLEKGLSGKGRT